MNIERVLRALDRLGLAVGWASAVAILVLVLAEIAVRAAGRGLPFTSEYSSLLMAWLIFFPLAEVTRRHTHISADFLVERMGPRLKAWVAALGAALTLAIYVGLLGYVAWTVTANSIADDVRSQGLMRTPLAYPQIGMCVGLAIMQLRALAELVRAVAQAVQAGRRPAGT